jgi:DNA helicase-2/ATP-dependent DNA helicase PcrA
MGTFHSVFAKILRIEGSRLGYTPNFTIYDSDDSKSLIRSIVKEFHLDDKTYKPNFILNRISGAKNNLISYQMYNENLIFQAVFLSSKNLENTLKRFLQTKFLQKVRT